MKTDKETETLLKQGYRCIRWGYRVNLCNKEQCHHKEYCIFMNGGPENYVNYCIKEELLGA